MPSSTGCDGTWRGSTLASAGSRPRSRRRRQRSKRPAAPSSTPMPRGPRRPRARPARGNRPRPRSSKTSDTASPAPRSARSGRESASRPSRPSGREDLLGEAEDAARETTLNLQRAAHETGRLWRQYKADREAIQRLVNRAEPGAGQVNGPPAACAWERELHELERALKRGDDLEPPLARWLGRDWRRQENAAARRLREERGDATPAM
jgi:hypothetical protein